MLFSLVSEFSFLSLCCIFVTVQAFFDWLGNVFCADVFKKDG